jgi:hypothetical protein
VRETSFSSLIEHIYKLQRHLTSVRGPREQQKRKVRHAKSRATTSRTASEFAITTSKTRMLLLALYSLLIVQRVKRGQQREQAVACLPVLPLNLTRATTGLPHPTKFFAG